MTSKLPDSTLDKIWELSDQDKDGFLDRYEYGVMSQLTSRAHGYGQHIPDQLPLELSKIIMVICDIVRVMERN